MQTSPSWSQNNFKAHGASSHMETSPSWSSLNARFHRDRAELTGHWDPRPERNSLLSFKHDKFYILKTQLKCGR